VVNTPVLLARLPGAGLSWCLEWEEALRALFAGYVEAKLSRQVLDYDDLLLYWYHLVGDSGAAKAIAGLFDHILVDEYQDTNVLQAEILRRLRPDGRGLCVVGDDAQSIYAFRAATVRNILDFPKQFTPPATVLTLAQNYRSTQPIWPRPTAVIGLRRRAIHQGSLHRAQGWDAAATGHRGRRGCPGQLGRRSCARGSARPASLLKTAGSAFSHGPSTATRSKSSWAGATFPS